MSFLFASRCNCSGRYPLLVTSLGALWARGMRTYKARGVRSHPSGLVVSHRRDFSRGYNFGERNGHADYLRKCEEAFNSV